MVTLTEMHLRHHLKQKQIIKQHLKLRDVSTSNIFKQSFIIMNDINYNLERFIEAQHKDYAIALSEIKHGKKQSHWMWYIFPQVQGLGLTATSKHYAIKNIDEATAYLSHEFLGKRLMEISNALLEIRTNNASIVFGNPDNMKLRSSMTLFAEAKNADPIFQLVLDKFFNGKKDERTLQLLKS